MRNLSSEEQFVRGVEFLALSKYYFHGLATGRPLPRRRRGLPQAERALARPHNGSMTATMLAVFLDKLHGENSLRLKPESQERHMRNHVRTVLSEIPTLKKSATHGLEDFEVQRILCSRYLWNFKLRENPGFAHNDSAIDSYVSWIALKNAPAESSQDYSRALLDLIVLRYAIKLGLRLDTRLSAGRKSEFMRCYVVSLETRAQHLAITVFEPDRQNYRTLDLADIEILHPDLWKLERDNVPCAVPISLNDAQKQVGRAETRLTCIVPATYYKHFMRQLIAPVDVLSRSPHVVHVEIRGMNAADLEQAVFPHLPEIQIEPPELREAILRGVEQRARRIRETAASG